MKHARFRVRQGNLLCLIQDATPMTPTNDHTARRTLVVAAYAANIDEEEDPDSENSFYRMCPHRAPGVPHSMRYMSP